MSPSNLWWQTCPLIWFKLQSVLTSASWIWTFWQNDWVDADLWHDAPPSLGVKNKVSAIEAGLSLKWGTVLYVLIPLASSHFLFHHQSLLEMHHRGRYHIETRWMRTELDSVAQGSQTTIVQTSVTLNTLISCIRCTWLWLELKSAGW